MRSVRTFNTAVRALRRNVMRAVLTTLGIVIGIGSVIAMMEIGTGSSKAMQKTVASMGANNLMIFPGQAQTAGVSAGQGSSVSLTPGDCDAIQQECPSVQAVAPVVWGRTQIVANGKNWVPQNMAGTTPDYLNVRQWPIDEGDNFTDRDVRNRACVCLIGQTLKRELFGGQSPVGKEMRVNNITFRVVGVLGTKGANMMGQDQDDQLIAPWTTIKYRVSGSNFSQSNQSVATVSASGTNTISNLYPSVTWSTYPTKPSLQTLDSPMSVRFANINQIVLSAVSADQIQPAITQVTSLLRDRHRLRDGEPSDFDVRNLAEFMKVLSSTTTLMTNLLLCVAAISLIVGGVGIMNIMLVSVTERTREIGLRMAVGARGTDILRQFLTESVVLCLLGGALGILLGAGTSTLVSMTLGWPTASSPAAIVAAVLVSATVGIVFGYYPAWKASRLDPIDALRYE